MPSSWLLNRWNALRSSYWLMPLVLAIAAVVLSQVTLQIDERWAGSEILTQIYPGGPEGARVILATIASSMIGVAGVVFSITVVALTMASAQLGPRLLRTFLRDWTNQLSMGTFLATFLYCIITLRAVSSAHTFVPAASVSVAVGLAVACIAVLIYFIHNATASLQADRVVAGVARDLLAAVDRFAPGRLESPCFAATGPEGEARSGAEEFPTICSETDGYVQAVDYEALFRVAKDEGTVLHIERRAGHFVSEGSVLVRAAHVDADLAESVRASFLTGSLRTEEQDVEYALNQLVEVALRALSPGVNDPFTAMTCIDWLGAGLARALDRGVPPAAYNDDEGELRLVTSEPDLAGIMDCAFDQIRQAARETPAILIRLAAALSDLASRVTKDEERSAVRRHVALLRAEAARGDTLPEDMSALTSRLSALEASLDGDQDSAV